VRRSLRADPSVFHLHSACWHVALCLNRMDRDSRSRWQASLRSPRRPSSPSTPSRRLGRAFDHEQDRERELVATMRDALAEATSMLEAKAQARRHDERVPPSRVDALEEDVHSLARGVERLHSVASDFMHRTRVKDVELSSPRLFALEQDLRSLSQNVASIAQSVSPTKPAVEPHPRGEVPRAWEPPKAAPPPAAPKPSDEAGLAAAAAARQAAEHAATSKALLMKAAEVQAQVARDVARLNRDAELQRLQQVREEEQRRYSEQLNLMEQQAAHRELDHIERQVNAPPAPLCPIPPLLQPEPPRNPCPLKYRYPLPCPLSRCPRPLSVPSPSPPRPLSRPLTRPLTRPSTRATRSKRRSSASHRSACSSSKRNSSLSPI
jgi:hypothetical protein